MEVHPLHQASALQATPMLGSCIAQRKISTLSKMQTILTKSNVRSENNTATKANC
jgi:hypothetical protein